MLIESETWQKKWYQHKSPALKISNLHNPRIWLGCTVLCHDCRSHPTSVGRQSRTCCWLCRPSDLYSMKTWISLAALAKAQCTYVSDERWTCNVPLWKINQSHKYSSLSMTDLVCGKQKDICARRVHLVTLTRVDCLLLYRFNLEWFELLVENLTLEDGQLFRLGSKTSYSPDPWQHSRELCQGLTFDNEPREAR